MDIIGVGQSGQVSFDEYKATVDVKPIEAKSQSEALNEHHKETKEQKEQVSPEVKKGIEQLNGFLEFQNAQAIVSRHKVFGDTMIKIVNKTTKEVLLEIPPEKILDMVAKLCEVVGLKLDKKA